MDGNAHTDACRVSLANTRHRRRQRLTHFVHPLRLEHVGRVAEACAQRPPSGGHRVGSRLSMQGKGGGGGGGGGGARPRRVERKLTEASPLAAAPGPDAALLVHGHRVVATWRAEGQPGFSAAGLQAAGILVLACPAQLSSCVS